MGVGVGLGVDVSEVGIASGLPFGDLPPDECFLWLVGGWWVEGWGPLFFSFLLRVDSKCSEITIQEASMKFDKFYIYKKCLEYNIK